MPDFQKNNFLHFWVNKLEFDSQKTINAKIICSRIGWNETSMSQARPANDNPDKALRPVPEPIFSKFLEEFKLEGDWAAYRQSGFATFEKSNLHVTQDHSLLNRMISLESQVSTLKEYVEDLRSAFIKHGIKLPKKAKRVKPS